jgi:hypothetical protein
MNHRLFKPKLKKWRQLMNHPYQNKIPSHFPHNLLNKGLSLEGMGISELAWEKEDVLRVIEFLTDNTYAILGGDVYRKEGKEFISTYDN